MCGCVRLCVIVYMYLFGFKGIFGIFFGMVGRFGGCCGVGWVGLEVKRVEFLFFFCLVLLGR